MKEAKGEVRTYAPVLRRIYSACGRFPALAACRALLILLLAILPPCSVHATTYTYDAAGRLKSATNSQGQTAAYEYDSRGNLISIVQTAATQLAIASFDPDNGPPGISVTINGSGFASSTSGNTVTFNGVSAPVLSAAPSQLLVQVPQNATTGPITVTTSSGSVTSSDSFYISNIGNPPGITGFTPAAANVGDAVTINGFNFNPLQGETTVTINGIFVPIATINDLQITVVVPPWVSSGPIEVTTPYGEAETGTVFYVMPIGIAPSSVALGSSLVVDGSSQSATFSSSTSNTALLFQGTIGEYASLQASSFSDSSRSVQYSIISPLGVSIAAGTFSASSPTVLLPQLNESGFYTVFLGQATGPLQFSLQMEASPLVVVNGPALSVTASTPGESKEFTFNVTAGENLDVGVTNVSVANYTTFGGLVNLTISSSDGSVTWGLQCGQPQCNVNLWNVPETGTYVATLVPPSGQNNETFGMTVTLSDSVTETLPTTDVPVSLNMPFPGQNGIYTFVGTAGQLIALQFATPSGGNEVCFQADNPDGSNLVGGYCVNGVSTYNLTLPQTGVYLIYVWLGNGGTPGSVVTTIATDVIPAPISINASAGTTIANQLGGQINYFTFNATAGENLGLGINNLQVAGNTTYTGSVYLTVTAPDGSNWVDGVGCSVPQCSLNLFNVPQTGTYLVALAPPSGQNSETFSMTVTLSDSMSATLPATDTPITLNMALAGQNGIYTFSGTAGQQIALNINSAGSTNSLGMEIINPDGSVLFSPQWIPTSTLNLTLPQTGIYTIYVWPGPGSITATLAVDAPPVALTTDITSSTVSDQLIGQNGELTFTATAGENLSLGFTNLSLGGSGGINASIIMPNGSIWTSEGCGPPLCDFSLFNAPMTGTYTVLIDPPPSATFSLSATVADSATGTLPATDTPTIFSMPIPGQNGILTFSGTAGEQVALNFNPAGPLGLEIINPSGSTLISPQWVPTSTLNLTLPQTGTYTIYIWPSSAPASITATLAVDAPPLALTTNTTASMVNDQLIGQYGYLTFNATAGENLGFGISNLTMSGPGGVNVSIYRPDGSIWTSGGCGPPLCDFNLFNAPMTGIYTVLINPPPSAMFSLSATVSDSATATLPSTATPITLNMALPGQNGIYTFGGTVGENVALSFSPSGSQALEVINPDGSTLVSPQWANTSTTNFTLAQEGTYTIYIWPGSTPCNLTASLTLLSTPNAWDGAVTFDPIGTASQFILSNSNTALTLASTISGGGYVSAFGNTGVNLGQWVYRVQVNSAVYNVGAGIAAIGLPASPGAFSNYASGYAATSDGNAVNNGNAVSTGGTYGTGSIIDVAFDAANGNLWVAIDGEWIGGGDPVAGTLPLYSGIPAGYYVPAIYAGQSGDGFTTQTPPVIAGFTEWPGEYSSINFVDAVGHAVTANGAAVVINDQYKFGAPPGGISDPDFSAVELLLHFEQPAALASSGGFGGSVGAWLTIPDSGDFDVGSGDFTWEGWIYPLDTSGWHGIFSKRANISDYAPFILMINGGQLQGLMSSNGTNWDVLITGGSGMAANVWHHVMMSRVSGTVYVGYDGNIVGSASGNFAPMVNTAPVAIGSHSAINDTGYGITPFGGYIDEVRYTKGVGRYSGSSYTVPTAAFPNQ